jgi:protein SCO1/2
MKLMVLVGLMPFLLSPSSAGEPRASLADIGPAPAVALTDQAGKPFSLASLNGKIVFVSFVYTTCNGSCPATTHRLYQVQEELKKADLWGKDVQFVSISLDPERDTPEVLARYAEIYDADVTAWHFLTGPQKRVNAVIAAWDMWARRNAAGVLDHPSRVFLLDARGHRREIYNLDFLKPRTALQDVQSLLAERRAR